VTSYHRPDTLDAALAIRAAGPVNVAAGCTDLFPATQAKTLAGPVLDITAIAALRGISHSESGIRIGGTTTWSDILGAELPPAFDALKLAAAEVGSVQIQNTGTIAGNLCTASPAGDGIPCLMALDASVELASTSGMRVMPLRDFLTGPRQTALRDAEILSAILIPPAALEGISHFVKLGTRKYLVISISMVAARLVIDDGIVRKAAISIGACSPVAIRLPAQETALQGVPIGKITASVSPDLITPHLSPIDDIRADQGYRKTAAVELVRRALSELAFVHIGAAA